MEKNPNDLRAFYGKMPGVMGRKLEPVKGSDTDLEYLGYKFPPTNNDDSVSWGELLEFLQELNELSPELMKQTVCINDGGSETYAKGIKRDHQNHPYLEGF